MTILDRFLALFALSCFALYLGVLAWRVPLIALIVFLVFGVLLAAIDFTRSAFWGRLVERHQRRRSGL